MKTFSLVSILSGSAALLRDDDVGPNFVISTSGIRIRMENNQNQNDPCHALDEEHCKKSDLDMHCSWQGERGCVHLIFPEGGSSEIDERWELGEDRKDKFGNQWFRSRLSSTMTESGCLNYYCTEPRLTNALANKGFELWEQKFVNKVREVEGRPDFFNHFWLSDKYDYYKKEKDSEEGPGWRASMKGLNFDETPVDIEADSDDQNYGHHQNHGIFGGLGHHHYQNRGIFGGLGHHPNHGGHGRYGQYQNRGMRYCWCKLQLIKREKEP